MKLNYGRQNFMARKLSIHLPYGQIYFLTKQHTNRHKRAQLHKCVILDVTAAF